MPTIQYDLRADTAGFQSSMKGATSAMKAGVGMAGALAAGALAVGAAFKGMADQLVATVDEVNTLAATTGLSTASVNGLRLAAEASGKSLTDLVPKDLALRMQKAADGSIKASKGFAELGVKVTDQAGKLRDSNAVYKDTLKALLAIEDPQVRAAKAAQALGDAGSQALSAFGDLSDFERFTELGEEFGFRAGPAAVAEMGEYQKGTSQISLAMETAAQTALDLVGGIKAIGEKMQAFALGAVFATEAVATFAREGVASFVAIGGAVDALARGDLAALQDQLGKVKHPTEAMADGFKAATEKARRFWELNKAAAPEAAEGVGRVTTSIKANEKALKEAEKAASSLARANRSLSDITFKAMADILTPTEKVEDAYLMTLEAIDKQEQAMRDLSATGDLTGRQLVKLETAKTAAAERRIRDISGIEEAAHNERIARAQAAQDQILQIEADGAALILDLETATNEARAEKRQILTEATMMGLNTIATTTAMVSDQILGALEEEGETAREKLDRQLAINDAIRAEGGEVTTAQKAKAKAAKQELKETQKKIQRAFAARQAAAVSGIAIDAAQGILSLVPFFAFLGPGAIPAAAGVVTPVALAQTAAVLSEQAPKIHDGTAAVDEVLATLRRGEAVLNQRGQESIGRDAIERANRGLQAQGPAMTQIVFRQRVLDTMMAETIEQGGQTQALIADGRPPAGTLDPYGGR